MGKAEGQKSVSSAQGARWPRPAQPSLLSQTPPAGHGLARVESDNLKAGNFKGKRDFRGLILPFILRRDLRAMDLNLTFLTFSVLTRKTEDHKAPASEGCHDDEQVNGQRALGPELACGPVLNPCHLLPLSLGNDSVWMLHCSVGM